MHWTDGSAGKGDKLVFTMSEESPRISPQERAAAAIAAAEEAARREEYLARRGSLAEEKFEAAQASATAPLSSGSVPPALDPRNFDFPSDAARRAEASEHEWLTPSSPGDGGPPPKTRSVSRAQSPTAAPFLPCPASVLKSSTRESSTFPETVSRHTGCFALQSGQGKCLL